MSTSQQIKTNNNQSPRSYNSQTSLERFNLSYEYNKTLRDIKREVKMRTV